MKMSVKVRFTARNHLIEPSYIFFVFFLLLLLYSVAFILVNETDTRLENKTDALQTLLNESNSRIGSLSMQRFLATDGIRN